MFESMGYLSRLLIAIFVVTVTPYLVAKIYQYINSMRAQTKDRRKSLNQLIREEMRKFGSVRDIFSSTSTETYKTTSTKKSRKSILRHFQDLLENPAFKDSKKVNALMPLLGFFDGDYSELDRLNKEFNNQTKCNLAKSDVIYACEVLELDKHNLFYTDEILSPIKLKDFFLTISLARNFYEDARRKNLSVLKVLESSRRYSEEVLIQSVMLIFVIRAGASERRVFEQTFNQKSFLKNRFNALTDDQIKKAILSISKIHTRSPLGLKSMYSLVKAQINRYDEFVKVYVKEKRAEQEKKQRQKKRKQSKESYSYSSRSSSSSYKDPYQKYYDLLECHPSDNLSKIKKSYHKLAMKFHPDRLKLESPIEQQKAHEKFTQIKEAFEKIEANKKSRAA